MSRTLCPRRHSRRQQSDPALVIPALFTKPGGRSQQLDDLGHGTPNLTLVGQVSDDAGRADAGAGRIGPSSTRSVVPATATAAPRDASSRAVAKPMPFGPGSGDQCDLSEKILPHPVHQPWVMASSSARTKWSQLSSSMTMGGLILRTHMRSDIGWHTTPSSSNRSQIA